MVRPVTGLILLAVFLVSNTHATVDFHFSGQLFCPLECFHYHLTLIEDDFFDDDYISHMPAVTSHYPHNYKADGQDTFDGCWCSYWSPEICCDFTFEIYLEIVHNCTPDGTFRKIEWIDFGKYALFEGEVVKQFYINVTNAGEPTEALGIKNFRGLGSGEDYTLE